MKFCPKCKTDKSVDEFYKSNIRGDGLEAYCKDCQKLARRERNKTPEAKAYIKAYGKTEKSKDSHRRWRKTLKGKESARNGTAKYRKNHRPKVLLDQKNRMSKKQRVIDGIKAQTQCYKCGYKNVFALTFHHIDPSKKEFCIEADKITKSGFAEELMKCICLCFNCHSIAHRTYGRSAVIGRAELDAMEIT